MSERKSARDAIALGLGLVATTVVATDGGPGANPYGGNPYGTPPGVSEWIIEAVQCRPDEVAANVKRLNALEIVEVNGLKLSIPASSPYCYNLPCGEAIEAAKQENCARADKLAALAEAAEQLVD